MNSHLILRPLITTIFLTTAWIPVHAIDFSYTRQVGHMMCGTEFELADERKVDGARVISICKNIAENVFHVNEYKMRPTSSKERFTVIRSGGVDVYVSASSVLADNSSEIGINFVRLKDIFFVGEGKNESIYLYFLNYDTEGNIDFLTELAKLYSFYLE
ncbi:MAG: hypothetical protein ABJQ71_18895 [Roseibium sp.]